MKLKYVLIKPSEDCPVSFLEDIDDVLSDPEGYGVDTFLKEVPENDDPNYWDEGDALLLKVEIVKVKVAATAFKVDD